MTLLNKIIAFSFCMASAYAQPLPQPVIYNYDNHRSTYGKRLPTFSPAHYVFGDAFDRYRGGYTSDSTFESRRNGLGIIFLNIHIPENTIEINHQLDGRISCTDSIPHTMTNHHATILGEETPTISSITGQNLDTYNRYHPPTSEALFFKPHTKYESLTLGSYHLAEGTYIGGQGAPGYEGGDFKSIHQLTIEGTEFRGGDANGTNDTAYVNHGGNGLVVQHASEGVIIDSVIHRSRDVPKYKEKLNHRRIYDAFIGGAGGVLTTANNVSDMRLTIAGGAGALILGNETSPAPIHITGGLFIGGGNRTNETRFAQINDRSATNVTLDARGGVGLHIEDAESLSLGGSYIIGGDAGEVRMHTQHSEARTHGGHGLYVTSTSQVSPSLSHLTCIGGDAADAKVTGTNSKALAFGGCGAVLIDQKYAVIDKMFTRGGKGALATANGSNSLANASGGHGLYLENSKISIQSGYYRGSDGGAAYGSTASSNGGSGLYVTNSTLSISDGAFRGGRAGNGPNAENGSSLTAINSDLGLYNGRYEGPIRLHGENTLRLRPNPSISAIINEGFTSLSLISPETNSSPVRAYHLLDGELKISHNILPSLILSNGILKAENMLTATNQLSINLHKIHSSAPIIATGPAQLDGELQLSIAPAAMEEADTIPLLTASRIEGTFTNQTLHINHCDYRLHYTTNTVYLEKTAEQKTTRGTPYWWLDKHGFTTTNTFEQADEIDHDHDGMKAYEEYIANTDPTDSTSLLTTHIHSITTNSIVISWPSAVDRNYGLWYSTNLTQQFEPIFLAFPGRPPTNHYPMNLRSDSPIFFRVSAELP